MTPQSVINEVVIAFGQVSGRQSWLEDLFWDSLWNVEFILRPDETIAIQSVVMTDNTDYLSFGLGTSAIDVVSVFNPVNGRELVRTSFRDFKKIPRFIPTGSMYVFDHLNNILMVNRDNGISPNLNYNVSVFSYTQRVASNVDVPILDRFYPVVRALMMARVSERLKDIERYQIFMSEANSVLGMLRGSGNERG